MMSFEEHLKLDRRLVILRVLKEDTDYTLSDRLLQVALRTLGHNDALPAVQADIQYLKEVGAVRYKVEFNDIYVVTLLPLGMDHLALRTTLPGVNRPSEAC